jgi:hypothetical protein
MKLETEYNLPLVMKFKMPNHDKIKNEILENINSTIDASSLAGIDEAISFTDYNDGGPSRAQYWQIILDNAQSTLYNIYVEQLNLETEVGRYWFQQYDNGSYHGWHYHPKSYFTNIYFLQLDEGTPTTEIQLPFTKEIIHINAEEGDVVIFPGFIKHRSPPNESNGRKTVVVWNAI